MTKDESYRGLVHEHLSKTLRLFNESNVRGHIRSVPPQMNLHLANVLCTHRFQNWQDFHSTWPCSGGLEIFSDNDSYPIFYLQIKLLKKLTPSKKKSIKIIFLNASLVLFWLNSIHRNTHFHSGDDKKWQRILPR